MRVAALLWTGAAAYAALIAVIYAVAADEPAGITLLVCGVAYSAIVAGWVWYWRRRHGDRRSDAPDADLPDDPAAVGVFAAASLRPLVLGAGMTAIALGLVIGVWLTLVGVAIVASQVALLVRDIDS